MTTFERQWSGGWVEPALPLTWSAEASPASPSASPAEASPRPTNAGSGLRRGPSFATYDRASRSWRTYRVSLAGDSETYSATWPRSGMTRSGTAYPLPPSAPLTDVTGSSSWLTPTVEDAGRQGSTEWAERWASGETPPGTHQRLRTQVLAWPSPRATDGDRGGRGDLLAMVRTGKPSGRKHWPTPTVNGNHNRVGASAKSGDGLATAVGGQLNPTWVEWLMGFPSGWSDLGPSETPSSPRSPSTSDDS